MGVDYGSGMVGCCASEIEWDYEELNKEYPFALEEGEDWSSLEHHEIGLEVLNLDQYSEYYDADQNSQYWGYSIRDIEINSDEFKSWLNELQAKTDKFERFTKNKAILIGTRDIY